MHLMHYMHFAHWQRLHRVANQNARHSSVLFIFPDNLPKIEEKVQMDIYYFALVSSIVY